MLMVVIASVLIAATMASVYGGLTEGGHFRIPILVLVVDVAFLGIAVWSTIGWLRAMRGRK